MSATTLDAVGRVSAPSRSRLFVRQVRDVAVLTFRNLVHIRREPLRLSDVTV